MGEGDHPVWFLESGTDLIFRVLGVFFCRLIKNHRAIYYQATMLTKFETKSARVKGKDLPAAASIYANVSKLTADLCFSLWKKAADTLFHSVLFYFTFCGTLF